MGSHAVCAAFLVAILCTVAAPGAQATVVAVSVAPESCPSGQTRFLAYISGAHTLVLRCVAAVEVAFTFKVLCWSTSTNRCISTLRRRPSNGSLCIVAQALVRTTDSHDAATLPRRRTSLLLSTQLSRPEQRPSRQHHPAAHPQPRVGPRHCELWCLAAVCSRLFVAGTPISACWLWCHPWLCRQCAHAAACKHDTCCVSQASASSTPPCPLALHR